MLYVCCNDMNVSLLFLSDEDMQSLASLMSVKPTDIGNLDDFNESDEEEDKKSVTATGRQTNSFSLVVTGNCFLWHFFLLYLLFPYSLFLSPLLTCCSGSTHSNSPKSPRSPSAWQAKLLRTLFSSLRYLRLLSPAPAVCSSCQREGRLSLFVEGGVNRHSLSPCLLQYFTHSCHLFCMPHISSSRH